MNGLPVFFAEIEDLDDVLVLDVAGHARFLQKASLGFGIGAALFGENLNGHGAADDRVSSRDRHATCRRPKTSLVRISRYEPEVALYLATCDTQRSPARLPFLKNGGAPPMSSSTRTATGAPLGRVAGLPPIRTTHSRL